MIKDYKVTDEGKQHEYPYVARGNKSGRLVLFTGEDSGFVVEKPQNFANNDIVGEFKDSWDEESFTKVNCTISFE